jgi:hypothetical protein
MLQVFENRLSVHEDQYTSEKVKLPPASEIPNVDLQVVNYHRPVFGTFHSKFTVIDREIALLQSSNIQDNDNLEMLSHIEGPIVDGFYDAALLSWGKPLDPPLPLLGRPAATQQVPWYHTKEDEPQGLSDLPQLTTCKKNYDLDYEDEALRVNNSLIPRTEETPTHAVTRHLSMFEYTLSVFKLLKYLTDTTIQPDTVGDAPDSDQVPQMNPYIVLPRHDPVPMALVNRGPFGGEFITL